MAVAQVFGAFEVEFDTTRLGGISAYDLGTGSNVATETSSGFYYPELPTLNAQLPAGSFTTLQIARALGLCGLLGTSIDGLTTGLKYYLREQAEGATRTAGSAHHRYVMRGGIIFPTTLTVDHQGDATLTYTVMVTYDGTNVPIVLTKDVALPGTQSDDQRFTLGPVTIESIVFAQMKQLTIDFGINAVSEGADSDIWDTFANIREARPSITLTGIDPDWFAAAKVPLLGLKVTETNTSIYLRKRAIGSTYVADGTAQHVKFSGAGLATIDNMIQITGQDASGLTLNYALNYDGSNAPLVIDTASTIV